MTTKNNDMVNIHIKGLAIADMDPLKNLLTPPTCDQEFVD